MNRYIKSIQLNKKLEEMGLENSTKWKKLDVYHIPMYEDQLVFDIADLLEPENAKKLWNNYRGKEYDPTVNLLTPIFRVMSNILLDQYQSGEEWEKWLEKQLDT